MKSKTSIGMLAAIAFSVGMVGINFSDGSFVMLSNTPSSTMEAGSILGHIELIHTDSEGNILAYQQTDNAIVNDGRNCTAMLLFGQNSGCTAGAAAGLGKYTVIGLGNGTNLPDNTLVTAFAEQPTTDGIIPVLGELNNATFTNATADSGVATQRIFNVFTYTGEQLGNPIAQAGLFNQTGAFSLDRGVFAMKNFASSINMNTNDQLTVNWDITIDGSDAIS